MFFIKKTLSPFVIFLAEEHCLRWKDFIITVFLKKLFRCLFLPDVETSKSKRHLKIQMPFIKNIEGIIINNVNPLLPDGLYIQL